MLNLLRPSSINPKLLTYAQLHEVFDYNATPLVTPGTKTIVHKKLQYKAVGRQEGCMDGTLK